MLIEKGANIEAKDGYDETPLHISSLYGRTDVVKYLISKGTNKYARNKSGDAPYDIVCNEYSLEYFEDADNADASVDTSQRTIIRELLK